MNKWLEILIGLILIIIPVLLVFGGLTPNWTTATIAVLRGGIVWGPFFLGLLFLLLGISELKN